MTGVQTCALPISRRGRAPGRYTFHDLIREYARSLAPAAGAPRQRLHDYYLAAAVRATDLISREVRRFEPRLARPGRTG